MSIKGILKGTFSNPKVRFTGKVRGVNVGGSSVIEDNQSIDDYSTKVDTLPTITLTRDTDVSAKDSCVWAEENDHAVHDAVSLLDNTMNNGFEVYINSDKDTDLNDKMLIKAKEYLEEEISATKDDLRSHTSALIRNRAIIGIGVSILKRERKSGDLRAIIDLDGRECFPIRNIETGKLGDGVGEGLDPEYPNKDVALVQKGHTVIYNGTGDASYSEKYYYFEEKDLLLLPNKDRGKMVGISSVRRVLRLVEIKLMLQNVLALLAKRFGPQIYVQLGNDKTNLQNMNIPDEYINTKDTNGNQVSEDVALESYKTDLFSNIESSLKDWVNGDNIFQLVEYGVEIKTINPSAGMIDLARYIQLLTNFIKIGILNLDVSGRVYVTSGVMEKEISKDLKDKVGPEREYLIDMWNERYVKIKLEQKFKRAIGLVKLRFKPMDRYNEAKDVEIEMDKSKTVYNYMKAGLEVPEYLKKKWGLSDLESSLDNDKGDEKDTSGDDNKTPVEKTKDKIKEEEEKTKNPALKKTIEELNKKR